MIFGSKGQVTRKMGDGIHLDVLQNWAYAYGFQLTIAQWSPLNCILTACDVYTYDSVFPTN